MAASFNDLNREMGEAREFLRSFTLGQRGFTQRDGIKAIDRVNSLCDQLQERFGSGKHAGTVAGMIVTARNQVQAAKARLSILQKGLAALV